MQPKPPVPVPPTTFANLVIFCDGRYAMLRAPGLKTAKCITIPVEANHLPYLAMCNALEKMGVPTKDLAGRIRRGMIYQQLGLPRIYIHNFMVELTRGELARIAGSLVETGNSLVLVLNQQDRIEFASQVCVDEFADLAMASATAPGGNN